MPKNCDSYWIHLATVFILSGCAGLKDVTDDKSFVIGYRKNQMLATVVPMVLERPSFGNPQYIFAIRGSNCNPELSVDWIPTSREELVSNLEKYSEFSGFLELGTKIIFKSASFQYGLDQRLYLYGEVASGEFAGTQVTLDSVSTFSFRIPSIRGGREVAINPNCLRPE